MRAGRGGFAAGARASGRPVGATAIGPVPPPIWRDAWAWGLAALLVPLFIAARGVPLGEPVFDDFDFLRQTRFQRTIGWLDGGGSPLYWRPLSRQLYYAIISPFAVSQPGLVVALQAGLLLLAGLLLYRALRPAWPGSAAAAAAAFVLALEASVQILTWAAAAQDLLALVAGAAALHALSRGRRAGALAWLVLALLAKETAMVIGLCLPIWPAFRERSGEPAGWRSRSRLAAGVAAALAIWWLVHEWVSRHAGLEPPPHYPQGGVWERLVWAAHRVGLEALNAADSPHAGIAVVMAGLLAVAALLAGLGTLRGRARLHAARPWLAWAGVWIVLTAFPIAWFMPSWGSFRAVIPMVGIGVALVALLGAGGAWAVAIASGLRLLLLLMVPPVPERIPMTLGNTVIEFDRAGLASMQRLVREVRTRSLASTPKLPHGARIVRYQWPRMTDLAFEGSKAFQVWYRDSSLRVVGQEELNQEPFGWADLAIAFEPRRTPQVAIISPKALQSLWEANRDKDHAALVEARLRDFEREQADTNAAGFIATGLALRGMAQFIDGKHDSATATLERALELNPNDPNAHRLLADIYASVRGRPDLAILELERHLAIVPDDGGARQELAQLRARVDQPR